MRVRVEIDKKYAPVALPANLQQTEAVDQTPLGDLPRVIDDNQQFLDRLIRRHEARLQTWDTWLENMKAKEAEEHLRMAPGYLDGPTKLLVPTRSGPEPASQPELQQDNHQASSRNGIADDLQGLRI